MNNIEVGKKEYQSQRTVGFIFQAWLKKTVQVSLDKEDKNSFGKTEPKALQVNRSAINPKSISSNGYCS